MKKILLISYNFPPYPGIGGRRWAKFAKYLKRDGNEIYVISSENPFKSVSEWNSDIKGINVERLPLRYPSSLITYPPGIVGRIRYKLGLIFVRILSNSNYYDRALFWEGQFINKANELIRKHDIKNVIVTGAPFHLLYQSTKLKRTFPSLNLIVDYRDYWNDDKSMSALSHLSRRRQLRETEMEKQVIEKADCIFAVSDQMTEVFQQRSPIKKCYTLPNGFDPEDYSEIRLPDKKDDKIRFIFTGNLYNNIENVFDPFCEALARIRTEYPELYKRVQFDFYGSSSLKSRTKIKQLGIDVVRFYPTTSLQNVFQKISESDYCLLFLQTVYSFSLSTKFCEYLGLNKPIVLFSEKGAASDYITENKIGIWIKRDETFEGLYNLILNHNNFPNSFLTDEIKNKHSVKELYKKIQDKLV